MEKPPRGDRVEEVIKRQALRHGVSIDQLISQKVGQAFFDLARNGEEDAFGKGHIVILEITGGPNPDIIVHGLVKKEKEAPVHTALIKRVKKISNSSIFSTYELPTTSEMSPEIEGDDDITDYGLSESKPVAMGRYPYLPKSTMHWVSGKKNL